MIRLAALNRTQLSFISQRVGSALGWRTKGSQMKPNMRRSHITSMHLDWKERYNMALVGAKRNVSSPVVERRVEKRFRSFPLEHCFSLEPSHRGAQGWTSR